MHKHIQHQSRRNSALLPRVRSQSLQPGQFQTARSNYATASQCDFCLTIDLTLEKSYSMQTIDTAALAFCKEISGIHLYICIYIQQRLSQRNVFSLTVFTRELSLTDAFLNYAFVK